MRRLGRWWCAKRHRERHWSPKWPQLSRTQYHCTKCGRVWHN